MTHSVHHIADPRLAQAIGRALARERTLVAARMVELTSHSAYKRIAIKASA